MPPTRRRLSDEIDELGALALDFRGRPVMVQSHHLAESFTELPTRLCVLLVETGGIGVPEACDLADGESLFEASAKDLHSPQCFFASSFCPSGEKQRSLPENRGGPGPIEDPREGGRVVLNPLEVDIAANAGIPTRFGTLEAESHDPGDPVQEGMKAAGPILLAALENTAVAEAVEKDFLRCIVEVIEAGRARPARGQVCADEGRVDAHEVLAVALVSRCRPVNERPAR